MIIKEGMNVVIYGKDNESLNAVISSIIIDEKNDFVDLELKLENGDNKTYAFESFGKCLYLSKKDLVNDIKYKQVFRFSFLDGDYTKVPEIIPDYFSKNQEINEETLKLDLEFSEKVKAFIEKRSIRNLYHFTNILNLESILKNDLMPVTHLKHKGISYIPNDETRYDGRLDCVSLSISFPNTRYMNSKMDENYDLDYCVIEYDSSIMVKAASYNKIYFSKYNAARTDTTISSDYEVLVSMFDDTYYKMNPTKFEFIYGLPSDEFDRQVDLPINYPTHDQAEVLINSMINKRNIRRIIFRNANDFYKYEDLLYENGIVGSIDARFFDSREKYILKDND